MGIEGLRSCDRKSRDLQVGKTEDISPKVWKTTLKHLSKKQRWRLGETETTAQLPNLERPPGGECQLEMINTNSKRTIKSPPKNLVTDTITTFFFLGYR